MADEKTPPQRHTDGPWKLETVKTSCGVCHKIGPFPSVGARSFTYGCVYEDGTSNWRLLSLGDFSHSEPYANARLMAAAPELFEALKAMVASYDGIRDSLASPVVLEKLERADAALAKADASVEDVGER